MTKEEKHLIKQSRIKIAGKGEFIRFITEELYKLGFDNIADVGNNIIYNKGNTDILIDYIEDVSSQPVELTDIPVICSFDFIYGAGVIVIFPGDVRIRIKKRNVRLWAAEYISGYCAFWNVEGSEWIYDALPSIKGNKISVAALKTAAYMCAKIAANIAVGRDVKHYPRFYLCRNLE